MLTNWDKTLTNYIINTDMITAARMVYSELGHIRDEENKLTAIALINAFLNLGEYTKESISVLLTGEEYPEKRHYGPKGRLFLNGRRALASTEFAPQPEEMGNILHLVVNSFIGKEKDPLYGEWGFFDILDEPYQKFIREINWGLDSDIGVTRGIIYGDYEFSPIGFLKARAKGLASEVHINRWEKQKVYGDKSSIEIDLSGL